MKESSLHTQERDWEQRARVQQAFARIYLHTGQQTLAQEALLDAVELFDRMGLVLESEAARAKYQEAL